MAWRPQERFIEGELDNTQPGRVTGWMRFVGMNETVRFDLHGNFHRDIRGTKLRMRTTNPSTDIDEGRAFFERFDTRQTGNAGDITAGGPPVDYVSRPYVEWYSQENGRVVIEPEPHEIEVIGQPIPWLESYPVDRAEQERHMMGFLGGLMDALSPKRRSSSKRKK